MITREALEKLAEHNGQSGSCWDDPSNLVRLNDVRALIYEHGDWDGTTEWICMNMQSGCSYLPFEFIKIISAYNCQKISIAGQFSSISHEYAKSIATGVARIVQTGKKNALFVDLLGKTQISISCDDERDVGTGISIWTPEKYMHSLTLGAQALSGLVGSISRFSKPITNGPVSIWSGQRLIGEWPSWAETGEHQQIRMTSNAGFVTMLCKKRFRKITDIDEPLDIDSLMALIFGYQAFNESSKGDDSMYVSKIRLMKNQLQASDHAISIEETEPELDVQYAQIVPKHSARRALRGY